MARRRSIDPDFFTDPDILEMEEGCRLFYIATWTIAEDSGVIPLSTSTLAFRSGITETHVAKYLKHLIATGKIVVFDDEKRFGWVKNFQKYQKIDKPSAPRLPLPRWIRYQKSRTNRLEKVYVLVPKEYGTSTGGVLYESPPSPPEDKISKDKISKGKLREEKATYAENPTQNVTLTEKEYQTLIEKHGLPLTNAFIQKLNNHKASKGVKYKSDYHAILNWVIDAVSKGNGQAPKGKHQQQIDNALALVALEEERERMQQ